MMKLRWLALPALAAAATLLFWRRIILRDAVGRWWIRTRAAVALSDSISEPPRYRPLLAPWRGPDYTPTLQSQAALADGQAPLMSPL